MNEELDDIADEIVCLQAQNTALQAKVDSLYSELSGHLEDEDHLRALNSKLVAALEHIRFCYWSENEPMSERVDYLQGKAGEAIDEAQP